MGVPLSAWPSPWASQRLLYPKGHTKSSPVGPSATSTPCRSPATLGPGQTDVEVCLQLVFSTHPPASVPMSSNVLSAFRALSSLPYKPLQRPLLPLHALPFLLKTFLGWQGIPPRPCLRGPPPLQLLLLPGLMVTPWDCLTSRRPSC